MGFRVERTVGDLDFDGTKLEGLTVTVEAMPMYERLHAFFDLAPKPGDTVEDGRKKQDEKLQLFIDHVVEWDMEDKDGSPVPVTVEGLLKACEPEQIGAILGAWSSGRQKISAPLEQRSPGSSLSEIPMTVLESTPEPVTSNAC